jgi:DNA-binding CsgD family transcriptional regulator
MHLICRSFQMVETGDLTTLFNERELDILRRIAQGDTNREIAEQLFISTNTVRWYNKQIYDKLDTHSRTAAVARARELGLLNAETPSFTNAEPELPKIEQRVYLTTTSDSVDIAYALSGQGPPLVKAANWLSHLEYDWQSPVWRHWLRELSRDHTLVRYDERGCGLSDWNVDTFSLDAWLEDLETVVNSAGLQRFPLLGVSQGGPVAIKYAVRHPEQVSYLRGVHKY